MDQITFNQPLTTPQEPDIVPYETAEVPNTYQAPEEAPVYVCVKDSTVVDNYGENEYVYIDICLTVSCGSSSDNVVKRLKFNRNQLAQDARECSQYKNDNATVVESEVNPYDLKKIATQRMLELAGISHHRNFV
jgi:hypothetical protein